MRARVFWDIDDEAGAPFVVYGCLLPDVSFFLFLRKLGSSWPWLMIRGKRLAVERKVPGNTHCFVIVFIAFELP